MDSWGLVIETAGASLQLGLIKDGEIVGGLRWDRPHQHSEKLIPLTKMLLAEMGIRWGDVRYAIYHQGPGSHTGLRIGLAAVKAWALSLGWKVYPVPLLWVLYHQARRYHQADRVFTFWEARRGEWYGQIWQNALTISPQLRPASEWQVEAADAFWIGNSPLAHYFIEEVSWMMVAQSAKELPPLTTPEAIIALTPLYFREFIPTQRKPR